MVDEHGGSSPQESPSPRGSRSPPSSQTQPGSQSQNERDRVQERSEVLNGLLRDAITGQISDEALVERLRSEHATPEETSDILDELAQRRQRPASRSPGHADDRLNGPPEPQEVLHDRFPWEIVRAKIDALRASGSEGGGAFELLSALRDEAGSKGIPPEVLAAAPHLASITSTATSDPHIAKTFQIRESFARESVVNRTIPYLQLVPLDDPLPRSIWRDIVGDKYMSFEKLYATIDSGFDFDDDVKDFGAGYVLLKKDQVNARKPLECESDWTRVFDAWASAVKLVYDHRASELNEYKRLILKLFRARRREPHVAIQTDHDIREEYAKSPFHLDDRSRTEIPLWAHLAAPSTASSSSIPSKRSASLASRISSAKRPAVVCENWNFGRCDDPCRGSRKHGECSECGAKHRAKDVSLCLGSLQARRGRRIKTSSGSGPSGGN